MDALKHRLDDLAQQASVDSVHLATAARADGTRMRRRRNVVTATATLASVAVLGSVAVGAAVVLAPDAAERVQVAAPAPASGPVAGVEVMTPEGEHPLAALNAQPFRHDPATTDVTLADGAPATVRLDGRIAAAIALNLLGEIAPGRYSVDAHSLLGSGQGDEVGDDGAVTGTGRLVEASAQMSIVRNDASTRLSVLVQQRQGAPKDVDCASARGRDDCEVVPQDDGSKVMAYDTVGIIDPARPELNSTRIFVDRYDPDTGLRVRLEAGAEDLGGKGPDLTREQLLALVTADVWAPVVPIGWYLAGQELEFVWSPSNEYGVLPDER